jgi:hypothetical protein
LRLIWIATHTIAYKIIWGVSSVFLPARRAVVALCALAVLITLPVGLITGNMILGEYATSDITYYIQHYTVVPVWLVVLLSLAGIGIYAVSGDS